MPETVHYRAAPPPVVYLERGKDPVVKWSPTVAPADYLHAQSFLTLAFPDASVAACMTALKAAPIVYAAAKDILRASGSPFLDASIPGVKRQTKLIEAGEPLSPILFIRGSGTPQLDGILADGLHRTLAAYGVDLEADIPVKLAQVDWAALAKVQGDPA